MFGAEGFAQFVFIDILSVFHHLKGGSIIVTDVVEILSRLVACPSVNPMRSDVMAEPFGEARLVALLSSMLTDLGADVQVSEIAPGRPNVVARFVGERDDRSLMFEAHSDTVQVADMDISPFEPVVRDGRLYGRGACDTKGPMAAMLAAIARTRGEGKPPVTLYFASTCDEEVGATGAAGLMQSGFRPTMAVVAEPTDLNVCYAHKGVLHWSLDITGKPAHSSMPDLGVSAIYPMAHIVQAIETQLQAVLKQRVHPVLGPATISVGLVQGGTQVNVVPSSCQAVIDRRMLPSEDVAQATAELQMIVDTVMLGYPDAEAQLVPVDYYPPLDTPQESGVARMAHDAVTAVLNSASFVTAPWCSNAGVFSAAGVPSVLFGPGSIRQAHTRDEYIEVEALHHAVDVYSDIIRRSGDVSYVNGD